MSYDIGECLVRLGGEIVVRDVMEEMDQRPLPVGSGEHECRARS